MVGELNGEGWLRPSNVVAHAPSMRPGVAMGLPKFTTSPKIILLKFNQKSIQSWALCRRLCLCSVKF